MNGSSRVFRMVPLFGVLVLLVLASVPTPAAAITYGVPDASHTSVGSLVISSPDHSWGWQLCSGTLIAPRVFLTAGHCTDYLLTSGWPLDWVYVTFDEFLFRPGGAYVGVSAVFDHPNYSSPVVGPVTPPVSNPYDVGVVILSDAVLDRPTVALPTAGYLDTLQADGVLKDARFLNVGYGTDAQNLPTWERESSTSGFLNLHKAWLYMSQNFQLGNGGTCYGDSGGPIFYQAGSIEQLVVITSWGDMPCKATNLAYRIDIPSSLTFLHTILATYAA